MFKKIRFGGRDSLGFGQVSLPHTTLQTTASRSHRARCVGGWKRLAGRAIPN
jgi:hypothetical protein